jgi:hypothetical protein
MANLLTRLTTIGVASLPLPQERTAEILGRQQARVAGPDQAPEPRVSIFINPQALTFPVAVALVKGAWEGLKLTPLPAAGTTWFPFLACLVIGVLITVDNLMAETMTRSIRGLGVIIGILNSLVMFAAVLGISR